MSSSENKTRRRLLELIESEIESPREYEKLLSELAEQSDRSPAERELLLAADERHRHAFYVRSEEIWFRRFGWRIMRPLFIVAVLAAIGFSLQRVVDPAIGLSAFLGGGVCVYLAIQFFAHRWSAQDERKFKKVDETYRTRLQKLRDSLD